MSLAAALKKVEQQSQSQAVSQQPLGRAPQTKEEADALRQQEAARQEVESVTRMRIQQLAGSIFTRLMGDPTLTDPAQEDSVVTLKEDGGVELDKNALIGIARVCNVVSSIAAQVHAQEVWGVTVNRQEPAQPTNQVVPPQQMPAPPAA